MPSHHLWLTQLMRALGYRVNMAGICHGYAMLARQAILLNQGKGFNKRIRYLQSLADPLILEALLQQQAAFVVDNEWRLFKGRLKKLLSGLPTQSFGPSVREEKVKEGDSKVMTAEREAYSPEKFWGAIAFLDAIQLYQDPEKHRELFPFEEYPFLLALARQSVYRLLTPQEGVSIKELARFVGSYYPLEVVDYLKNLHDILLGLKKSVASLTRWIVINLFSHEHSITIVYDFKYNVWLFIDAGETSLVIRGDTYTQLAVEMILALDATPDGRGDMIMFTTSVTIACRDDEGEQKKVDIIKDAIDRWMFHVNTTTFKKVHHVSTMGLSLLQLAIIDGDLVAVERLLTQGAAVYLTGDYGTSLFNLAVASNAIAVVRYFCEQGFDPNDTRHQPFLLNQAIESASCEMVAVLLQHRADPDIGENIFLAVELGSEMILKALVRAGVNPLRPYEGDTPLALALSHPKADTLAPIIEKAITIYKMLAYHVLPDKNSESPRYLAIKKLYAVLHDAPNEGAAYERLLDFMALDRLVLGFLKFLSRMVVRISFSVQVEDRIEEAYVDFFKGKNPWEVQHRLECALRLLARHYHIPFHSLEKFRVPTRPSSLEEKLGVPLAEEVGSLSLSLQQAVLDQDLQAMAALLLQGADPLTMDDRGSYPLAVALSGGNSIIFDYLLDYTLLLHDSVDAFAPLLLEAMKRNQLWAVRALLAAGVEIPFVAQGVADVKAIGFSAYPSLWETYVHKAGTLRDNLPLLSRELRAPSSFCAARRRALYKLGKSWLQREGKGAPILLQRFHRLDSMILALVARKEGGPGDAKEVGEMNPFRIATEAYDAYANRVELDVIMDDLRDYTERQRLLRTGQTELTLHPAARGLAFDTIRQLDACASGLYDIINRYTQYKALEPYLLRIKQDIIRAHEEYQQKPYDIVWLLLGLKWRLLRTIQDQVTLIKQRRHAPSFFFHENTSQWLMLLDQLVGALDGITKIYIEEAIHSKRPRAFCHDKVSLSFGHR